MAELTTFALALSGLAVHDARFLLKLVANNPAKMAEHVPIQTSAINALVDLVSAVPIARTKSTVVRPTLARMMELAPKPPTVSSASALLDFPEKDAK
ncbi:hypothetical protein NQ314_020693 [Rhamnusium bicolor]|uniref:Uncharacterized protein n=1 Tax=Rhamnusium bicolor TaxID=1586634 RepID=A0AAV8WK33_9CUCU|nr:hypothetical protein NQ314_020693 [Rhamnusium bicolor]